MLNWIKKLFGFSGPGGRLSSVVIYNLDHTTRLFTTPSMDERSKRKFLKHLFNRYSAKFIEIDGQPYHFKGRKIERL